MIGKRKSFSHMNGEEESVNLVPIMNLFVALIPFLLMSAAFFNISVINASVPALGQGKSDLGKSEEIITLMVQLMPEGLRINATSDTLSADKLAALRAEIPRQGKEIDIKTFSEYLMNAKGRYPKSDTIILVPAGAIPYQEVIQTMDISRRKKERGEDGKEIQYELFPNVVISGMM